MTIICRICFFRKWIFRSRITIACGLREPCCADGGYDGGGIEKVLLDEAPDYLMIYGDTNSTLAGALAAVKLHIPIIHVEAGLRSFNMQMPEEINRFCQTGYRRCCSAPRMRLWKNLNKEGIIQGVHQVGDVMCDAVLYYAKKLEEKPKEAYLEKLKGFTARPERRTAGIWPRFTGRRIRTTRKKSAGF